MSFLSDILLAAGAFAAAVYCLVLSRRLKALTTLDSGMGAAIAVLSAQVDELNTALRSARETAQGMSGRLGSQTERAENAARRLELLIAALHDLPEQGAPAQAQRMQSGRGAGVVAERSGAETPVADVARSRVLRRRSPERVA